MTRAEHLWNELRASLWFVPALIVAGSVVLARVGARVHDASDANAAIARQQEEYDVGAMDWIEIDASGTPDRTLRNALEALQLD